MRIYPEQISSARMYHTMTALVVPRPVAWVSTRAADGSSNLAPFSFFTGVTARPPTLCFALGNKADGQPKDTARNIIETGEFVVNVAPVGQAEAMVKTSAALPHGVDEAAFAHLEMMASERVAPGRVVGSPAQFECTLERVVELEDEGEITSRLIIGRIQLVHIADEVIGEDGRVDPLKLDAIARLGGADYARLTSLFQVKRPG